jgi:hypothetical protein
MTLNCHAALLRSAPPDQRRNWPPPNSQFYQKQAGTQQKQKNRSGTGRLGLKRQYVSALLIQRVHVGAAGGSHVAQQAMGGSVLLEHDAIKHNLPGMPRLTLASGEVSRLRSAENVCPCSSAGGSAGKGAAC